MLRRVSIICVATVVSVTGTVCDIQTAEAQLFRRLRSRIQSAIQSQVPEQPQVQGQPQRQPGQAQPNQGQSRTGTPTPAPSGRRVSPIGSARTGSSAAEHA